MDYGFWSLTIPMLTIVLALVSKDVAVSLAGGIFAGFLVLHGGNPVAASGALFNGIVAQLAEGWVAKTVLFSLLVGSVIALLEQSGAVAGFVSYIGKRQQRLDTPLGAQLLAYVTGLLIFIESSITSLVAGTVARPLCDKNGICREKLAYICDATSAPVCSLLPLNAWGALLLGLIATAVDAHVVEGNALALLIASLPYNFYAIAALVLVGIVIFKRWDIGPMRRCRAVSYEIDVTEKRSKPALMPMLLPVAVMVAAVPVGLYVTGNGDIFKGSGSTAVYYATLSTIGVMYPLYVVFGKRMSHRTFRETFFEGMGKMIPVAVILLLAIFIGKVIGELGTARYLASVLQGNISPMWVPLLVFLTASITSFSTGTSWGTFSIMMPIALALGAQLHVDIPLLIGAVVAGGIFGDHASPISDTTVISAMAAGCDTVEHVRTQLPYALIGGTVAAVGFLAAGYVNASSM